MPHVIFNTEFNTSSIKVQCGFNFAITNPIDATNIVQQLTFCKYFDKKFNSILDNCYKCL